MKKYIFGARNKIYIIDLQITLKLLTKALDFTSKLAANGGKVLFVGSKQQAREILQQEAKRCQMPYVTERWLGGMLTNFDTIKTSVARLKHLEEMETDGSFKVLAKKEVIRLQREEEKLERYLGGVKDMDLAVFSLNSLAVRLKILPQTGLPPQLRQTAGPNQDLTSLIFPRIDDW